MNLDITVKLYTMPLETDRQHFSVLSSYLTFILSFKIKGRKTGPMSCFPFLASLTT